MTKNLLIVGIVAGLLPFAGGNIICAPQVDILAALWPERVKALILESDDRIGNQQAGKASQAFAQAVVDVSED